MAEQYQNDPADTTLDEDLDGSETTVTVADGSVFPATGDFRVRVDDELMLVTARAGNDLTVTRGAEGTAAAAHTTGAAVTMVLTRRSLLKILEEGVQLGPRAGRPAAPYPGTLYIPTDYGLMARYNGSAWEYIADGRKVTPPAVADFTWVNQSTAAAVDRDGVVIEAEPTGADNNMMLVRATPGATYNAIVSFRAHLTNTNFFGAGLVVRQSSDGKLVTWRVGNSGTAGAANWNGATSFNAGINALPNNPTRYGSDIHLRIERTGANRNFYVSTNRHDWVLVSSTGHTAFLVEDQVGLCIHTNHATSANVGVQAWFYHFDLY